MLQRLLDWWRGIKPAISLSTAGLLQSGMIYRLLRGERK